MTPILTADQVADLLGCAQSTVEDYARDGKIPCIKIGVSWRYPADALIRWANQQAEDAMRQPAKPVAAHVVKRVRPDLRGV